MRTSEFSLCGNTRRIQIQGTSFLWQWCSILNSFDD